MGKFISAILIIVCFVWAYYAGFFDWIILYFGGSINRANQETVMHNPDGSTTTVKYKNVFNVIFDKE